MPDEVKEKDSAKLCSVCGKPKGEFVEDSKDGAKLVLESCSCSNSNENIVEEPAQTEKTEDEKKKTSSSTDDTKNKLPDFGSRYKVVSQIGQGGMGTVYKVIDNESNLELAIKVMKDELAQEASAVKRFLQESESQANLKHQNIASVHGTGKTDKGIPYLIMDYIDGKSLSEVLKEEEYLEKERAINILTQVAEGLKYAHENDLIHRDLKPSNIILSKDSAGKESVYLVDFGIAKIQQTEIRQTQNLTQTGDVVGSPKYMSPEQCLNVQVDKRTDIYSFGCVVYETLTGEPPFSGSNSIQVIARHLTDTALSIKDHPNLKAIPDMESIVSTCLEKDPEARYENLDALIDDLKSLKEGKKPAVARRINLLKKSKPVIPIVTAILTLFSWAWLGFSAINYENRLNDQVRSKAIIAEANSVSKGFYDAGVAMGGYSITKSPLFSDRYDKIVAIIPEDMAELHELVKNNPKQLQSMRNIFKTTTSGLRILGEAKAAIDDNRVDVAQFRARHMYKEMRSIGDKLQDELRGITDEARRTEKESPYRIQLALQIFIASGVICLFMNIFCMVAILRYKKYRKD